MEGKYFELNSTNMSAPFAVRAAVKRLRETTETSVKVVEDSLDTRTVRLPITSPEI
jgi:hypothetical protein